MPLKRAQCALYTCTLEPCPPSSWCCLSMLPPSGVPSSVATPTRRNGGLSRRTLWPRVSCARRTSPSPHTKWCAVLLTSTKLIQVGLQPQGIDPMACHDPPCSPDMHKVNEHIFNTMDNALVCHIFPVVFPDGHAHHFSPKVWDTYVWCVIIKKESIEKDICSLKKTCRWIVGHGGEFTPHGLN